MNTFRKTTLALVIAVTGFGVGSVFAQAEQANEAAADAAANAEVRTEADSRAIRDGDTITTNKTVVEKVDGAPAQVTTPDAGRADVVTPNRGVAAEARRNETAAVPAVPAPRGNGRN